MAVDAVRVPEPLAGGMPVTRDARRLDVTVRQSWRSSESTYSSAHSATDPSKMSGPTNYAAVPILGDTDTAASPTRG